jgi:CRP/FNR family transcriptional regulator, nitrogen oxide reductase regulator
MHICFPFGLTCLKKRLFALVRTNDGGDEKGLLDVSLICDLQPFDGMEQADMQSLLAKAKPRRFEKGASIFAEGEDAHSFFLLMDGHIQVAKVTSNGDQVIARYISNGQLFGIAKALGRSTYPANAIAAVDCLVLAWPTAIWDEVVAAYPGFALSLTRTVGKRLAETQEQVMALATAEVEQRVANAILKLANQTGRKTEDGILIDFPLSRQNISDMTGTTQFTVSRLMRKWEEMGWVKSSRQRIILVEGHKLMLVATGAK